jgi:hypothetical protein
MQNLLLTPILRVKLRRERLTPPQQDRERRGGTHASARFVSRTHFSVAKLHPVPRLPILRSELWTARRTARKLVLEGELAEQTLVWFFPS